MSKEDVRRPVRERNSSFKEKDEQKPNYNLLSKHLKKVYPDKLYNASTSPLSLSSLSLSLSQNSSDSTDSSSTLNQKISDATCLTAPREKREFSTLRSPKAEAISKDLLKRGFRFVGPVIVYSFMQAAGMTIDHLVDCFRFTDCASHAERP